MTLPKRLLNCEILIKLPSWCPFQMRLQERDEIIYHRTSNQEFKVHVSSACHTVLCGSFRFLTQESALNCLLPTTRRGSLKAVWGQSTYVFYKAEERIYKKPLVPSSPCRVLAGWIFCNHSVLLFTLSVLSYHGLQIAKIHMGTDQYKCLRIENTANFIFLMLILCLYFLADPEKLVL